jgi:hypothetical protein
MKFDTKRRKKLAGQKAQHRNPQILRPGAKRHAVLAQRLAVEQRQDAGRAESNGDKECLLTDALQKRLCNHLRDGASFADAATLCGIGSRTITTWRTKGVENPDSRYGEFLEATELARTQWKVSAIERINQSADWKALWKLLCAKFPLEYRNYMSVSTEMSGPDGGPIPIIGNGGFTVVLELNQPGQNEEDEERQFRIVE